MLTAATVLAASTAKLVGHRLRHIMIALVERRLRLRRIAPRVGLLLAAMVVVGVLLELTPEDGFRVFRAWTASGLPTDARSASPTTPRFAPSATPPFGQWSTAQQLKDHGARYVLTNSLPIHEGLPSPPQSSSTGWR
jgi:hypothetical protein